MTKQCFWFNKSPWAESQTLPLLARAEMIPGIRRASERAEAGEAKLAGPMKKGPNRYRAPEIAYETGLFRRTIQIGLSYSGRKPKGDACGGGMHEIEHDAFFDLARRYDDKSLDRYVVMLVSATD